MDGQRAETFLNDSWMLYFHDPDRDAWDIDSYEPLATASTVEDVVDIHAVLKNYWAHGMFFMMREHILPIWEDRHNKEGGCLSFKIMKGEVPDHWFELMARVAGENVLKAAGPASSDAWEKICGVSISPKRHFCILRIWVAEPSMRDETQYALTLPSYTTMMFKSYRTEEAEAA